MFMPLTPHALAGGHGGEGADDPLSADVQVRCMGARVQAPCLFKQRGVGRLGEGLPCQQASGSIATRGKPGIVGSRACAPHSTGLPDCISKPEPCPH